MRGLVQAAVDPHPHLVGGRLAALVGRHRGVAEERHQAVGEADLAVRHPEQRAVATVPVEEHEPAGRRPGDGPADGVDHGEQGGRVEPHRPADQACSLDLL